MWIVGTCGLNGCSTREMPVAKKGADKGLSPCVGGAFLNKADIWAKAGLDVF